MKSGLKKYYSAVDMFSILLIVMILIVTIVSPFISATFWITNIIYFLILAFIIYSYFTVYYQFDRKSMIITEGKNNKEIYYREITSVEIAIAKSRKDVVGFTKKCIVIKYGKNGRYLVRISPRKFEEIYLLLIDKCKKIKEEN